MDNFLKEYIKKIGITLSDVKTDKLNRFYEMLIEKNKVMNLTAITEYKDVVIKHFADSLAIVNTYKDVKNVKTLIDIGTGAGFPGIVLKIVFPEINISLLDSLNKRINFLNDVIKELELSDIKAMHGRAEDFAHDLSYREQFDVCVSRAVANLSTLSEYCIPFVKKDGFFISYKAGECDGEISAASNAIIKLGGKTEKITEFVLPETDISRKFIIIKKISSTPKKFPRKSGIPSKEPLR